MHEVASVVVDEFRWVVVTRGISQGVVTVISHRLITIRTRLQQMIFVASGTRTQPVNLDRLCRLALPQCSPHAATVVVKWDLVVHFLDPEKILGHLQEQERHHSKRKRRMPPMQTHLGKHALLRTMMFVY
jgi:hypothetical protein